MAKKKVNSIFGEVEPPTFLEKVFIISFAISLFITLNLSASIFLGIAFTTIIGGINYLILKIHKK